MEKLIIDLFTGVKLQGPEEDVNKCHKYIFELLNEVTEPSYILEVPICRQYYEHIIGKGGANISKVSLDINIHKVSLIHYIL